MWNSTGVRRGGTSGERARSRASAGPAAAGQALELLRQAERWELLESPLRQPERSPAATNAFGGQNCGLMWAGGKRGKYI